MKHLSRYAHWLKREQLRLLSRLFIVAGRSFFRDNGPTWAAAIAYYSLLSLFPLLLAAGSVASYFIDPQWAVLKATALLGDFLPKGRLAIETIIKEALEGGDSGLGVLFVLPLIWTGTLVFGAVTKALNVAFEVQTRPSYYKQLQVRLVMLLSLGVIFLLALGSSPLLRVLRSALGALPLGGDFIAACLVNFVPAFLVLVGFILTYRFVPAKRPGWRAAIFGATVAALVFLAAKPLFLGYVQVLARYNFVYGSLAGIIAAVIWAWVVAMIGIFGGQMASLSQSVIFDGEKIEDLERRHLPSRPSAPLQKLE